MSSIVYPLILLLIASLFIQPTTAPLPTYLQNLELDDVTSLWDKFPSLIAQIKQAGMLFKTGRIKVKKFFLFASKAIHVKERKKGKTQLS
jgi:hypothetical protein